MAAAALVVGGKWARGAAPNIDNAIGIAGIALGLAMLEQFNVKFAKAFGVLILMSLAVVHLPTIVQAAGLSKGSATPVGLSEGRR